MNVYTDCPFCDYKGKSIRAFAVRNCVAIEPLNPVTPGHIIIFNRWHLKDISQDFESSKAIFECAILEARRLREQNTDCNIILNNGTDASKTVEHTHVHVVPRRPNDGLVLPWTNQKTKIQNESLC